MYINTRFPGKQININSDRDSAERIWRGAWRFQ